MSLHSFLLLVHLLGLSLGIGAATLKVVLLLRCRADAGFVPVYLAVLWALGPFIDKVLEPRFKRLAPTPGTAAAPEFAQARQHYLTAELIATGLFYAAAVVWVWQR